jgi:serine/threonine-protein kinase OSR1/STK39
MPFFSGGSVLNIMKWGHPQVRRATCARRRQSSLSKPCAPLQGLEEPVIATIIDAVLKALSYFHRNGNIHRDIKACCMCNGATDGSARADASGCWSAGWEHPD